MFFFYENNLFWFWNNLSFTIGRIPFKVFLNFVRLNKLRYTVFYDQQCYWSNLEPHNIIITSVLKGFVVIVFSIGSNIVYHSVRLVFVVIILKIFKRLRLVPKRYTKYFYIIYRLIFETIFHHYAYYKYILS